MSTSITIQPAIRSLVSAKGPSVTGGRPCWVTALRETITTPTEPPAARLVVLPIDSGEPRVLAAQWDRRPPAITTPMLVIHGDRDYRVPIGEGLS